VRIPLGAKAYAAAPVVLALVLGGLAVGARARADVHVAVAAALPAVTEERLSDGRTYTRWAHPLTTAPIHADPLPGAAVLGDLHMLTEDGEPEVYMLLDERTIATGETWIQLRIPGRPNGRIGWVPRGELGSFHLTHWTLQVALSRLRATLFLDGHATWSAPIGVGSPATPTPTGHYWVRELLRVSGHTLYGPFAFGTSDYSVLSEWPHGGVVGIHGTNQPQLIPGRPSHGCVRMSNTDITYLAHHLPIGAPVNIVA
jgi:L,D-transpeptidase catalytic domain